MSPGSAGARGTSSGPIPLAVRLPNWVGDVCMAVPTFRDLAAAGFAPHLVGRGWAADLLAALGMPVASCGHGVRYGSRALRATGARCGLVLAGGLSAAIAMWCAGVRAVGYRGPARSLLLAVPVVKESGRHEVEHFHRLGRACRDAWLPSAPWPEGPPAAIDLPLADAHRQRAGEALRDAGVSGEFTVLCPLAVGTTAGEPRVWPHWRALAARLSGEGVELVACPGPGEEADCRRVVPEATQLTGLGLGAYAAVLARAKCAVANDSGPMHLAAAVGTPVLGVVGPGDPRRTGPWGGTHLGGNGVWPELESVLASPVLSPPV